MYKRSLLKTFTFVALSVVSVNAFADEPAPAPQPEPYPQQPESRQPAPPPPPPAYAPQYAPAPAPYGVAAPAPRPFPDRDGFTIGFGLGAGTLSLDDDTVNADTSVGISLRAGVALSQNFLLQGVLEGTRAQADGGNALQLNFAGVQGTFYVHPRFYLVGGLGVASLELLDKNNEVIGQSKDSGAALLGVGVEAYQSSGFALSIELRGFGADFDGHSATGGNLLVGFQWF